MVCFLDEGNDSDPNEATIRESSHEAVCRCDGSLDRVLSCLATTRDAIAKLSELSIEEFSDGPEINSGDFRALLSAKAKCAKSAIGCLLSDLHG
ncbi:hypothetical protein KJ951_04925 [Patescibacteria group bacterium]|nr:hypothetical protein [Patescibacteria group bacterium]